MRIVEPGYEIIVEIEALFIKRLSVASFPEFGLGHAAIKHNGSIPRIVVVDVGGGLGTGLTEKTGGEDGDLATDVTRWDVFIWGHNLQECRELYYEFLRACREHVGTSNLGFEGQYRMDEPSNATRGRLLVREDLTLNLGVSEFTSHDFATVEVQKFETAAGTTAGLPEFTEDGERIEYDYSTLKNALLGTLTITQPPE